jgi:DNA-binding Lrp family transcriptional regulator
MHTLDQTDWRLLALLQTNSQLTSQQTGQELGLSTSQVGRRRQKLQSANYITSYTARLNPDQLGLAVQAFVHVYLQGHSTEHSKALARLIALQPEIVSAWTLTGEAYYLLRIYCDNLKDLNCLTQDTLLSNPAVARIQSQIVMDHTKADAPLPVRGY